jgi:hypothetical protein
MARESGKKTNRVTVDLNDEDFMLLSKAANLDDRALGEFLRSRIVRPWLHGNSKLIANEGAESNSDFAAL